MTARAIVHEVQAVGGGSLQCTIALFCFLLVNKIGHFIFRLEKSLKL